MGYHLALSYCTFNQSNTFYDDLHYHWVYLVCGKIRKMFLKTSWLSFWLSLIVSLGNRKQLMMSYTITLNGIYNSGKTTNSDSGVWVYIPSLTHMIIAAEFKENIPSSLNRGIACSWLFQRFSENVSGEQMWTLKITKYKRPLRRYISPLHKMSMLYSVQVTYISISIGISEGIRTSITTLTSCFTMTKGKSKSLKQYKIIHLHNTILVLLLLLASCDNE